MRLASNRGSDPMMASARTARAPHTAQPQWAYRAGCQVVEEVQVCDNDTAHACPVPRPAIAPARVCRKGFHADKANAHEVFVTPTRAHHVSGIEAADNAPIPTLFLFHRRRPNTN